MKLLSYVVHGEHGDHIEEVEMTDAAAEAFVRGEAGVAFWESNAEAFGPDLQGRPAVYHPLDVGRDDD